MGTVDESALPVGATEVIKVDWASALTKGSIEKWSGSYKIEHNKKKKDTDRVFI